jgi:uncharacterized protein GlcG (DUF336 family)
MKPRVLDRVVLSGALIFALGWTGHPHRAPVTLPARPVHPLPIPAPSSGGLLSAVEVEAIVTNAALEAQRQGMPAVIAVVDREENILGVYKMTGARESLTFVGKPPGSVIDGVHGLDGLTLAPSGSAPGPGIVVAGAGISDPTVLAAITKAGTAAVFQTSGNAFTTRTASFIIQEHFPPGIDFVSGGPLFGVQFSNLTCTDVKKTDPPPGGSNIALPLGLSGDPGGLPLYKDGQPVGAIGIESDGIETVVFDPAEPATPEELTALAGTRGYEAPPEIRGDQILANGIRLPFVPAAVPAPITGPLPDGDYVFPAVDGSPSIFVPVTIAGLPATVDPRFYPFVGSAAPGGLSASEVERIIGQALAQAYITRAAIRRPLGSFAQVNVTVVDASGTVLGIARTPDAPVFGFDVSAQKARTTAFFSGASAASALIAASDPEVSTVSFFKYVDRAAADGLLLNGSVAFTDRATGFLSRPFYPDGINGTPAGPFSRPFVEWSPFNDGLQIDLLADALKGIVAGTHPLAPPCTAIPAVANGIQIFPGSVPLYKNGVLVGGVGVSGDGVDQDDIISAMGSTGFDTPSAIRSDRVFVRGVRLPWVKFPRHPDL